MFLYKLIFKNDFKYKLNCMQCLFKTTNMDEAYMHLNKEHKQFKKEIVCTCNNYSGLT